MVAGILQAAGMSEAAIGTILVDLSRQREKENIATTIGGHPIKYWHEVAMSAMKTNDELITNLRERAKEAVHQRECAGKAIEDRDKAIKEADELRTKLIHMQRQMDLAKTALLNA